MYDTPWRIAVLIPTYNEPEEILTPTIAAAVALRRPTRPGCWTTAPGRPWRAWPMSWARATCPARTAATPKQATSDNPLRASGLTLAQRLAYAFTLLGWFDAWRTLGYLLVPMAVLFTGAVPIAASLSVFVPVFLAVLGVQQLALWLLGRGYYRPWLGILFDLVRLPANLAATLTLLRRRERTFQVTVKGKSAAAQRRTQVPVALWLLLAGSAAAAGCFAATVAGLTPLHYGTPALAVGALLWLLFNAAFVGMAIVRIRALRYGPERRASVRFAVSLPGRLDGRQCVIDDLSLTGARVRATTALPAAPAALAIMAFGSELTVECVVRGHTAAERGEVMTLAFRPGQWLEPSRLTALLFNAGVGLESAPAEPLVGAAA